MKYLPIAAVVGVIFALTPLTVSAQTMAQKLAPYLNQGKTATSTPNRLAIIVQEASKKEKTSTSARVSDDEAIAQLQRKIEALQRTLALLIASKQAAK